MDNTIISHPAYYGGEGNPYECIKVIEAWKLGFHLGNVLKYIKRSGEKDSLTADKDLEKAKWYLERYIEYTFPKGNPVILKSSGAETVEERRNF